MSDYKCVLSDIKVPEKDSVVVPVELSDKTIEERFNKVISSMKQRNLEALVIYSDLEHGSNFEYLVGFLPRFEEALLVIHQDRKVYLVLGNENLNKASKARITAEPVLSSYFSLPNQPMNNDEPFIDVLRKTQIENKRTGLIGWKNFTSRYEDNKKLFDAPSYIADTVKCLCGEDNVTNETDLFIGDNGVRITNNANEIAHYEVNASLAGDCMLDALDALKEGVSEMEVADKLLRYGQRTSVVTICAFGPRFIKANMYPTGKRLRKGDSISLTVGYRGGLSSRSLIAVESFKDLPEGQKDYIEKVVSPYYKAICTWLENVHIGMSGDQVYKLVDQILPKNKYKWSLCPGHLSAEEEWLSSPIYEGSKEILKSGEIFQTDIIPTIDGYPGTSVESTCVLADDKLKEEIRDEYPELWNRIQKRREYILKETGIHLNEDILPLCSSLTYLRPFAFSKKAMKIERE